MRRHFRQLEEKDDQGNAGASEVGVGAAGAALSKCAEESEAAGGVVAGDAAGDGAFGGPGCESDGFFNEDGVPGGAVGTEEDDQPAPSGKDGAGGGMRCGVRAGAVDSFAGRPGQGTGGTGGVEEEVHEKIRNRDQGTGNRDQGTGIREQGTGIREQGSGNRDQDLAASGSRSFCGTSQSHGVRRPAIPLITKQP